MSFDYDGALERAKKKWLKKAALVVKDEAVNRTPVDTDRLAGSINERVKDDYAEVGTNVEYAPHVEYGTQSHTITVKNAKVLTDGKNFYGKTVHHPGTREQPFMRPAVDNNKRELNREFGKMLHDEYQKEARRGNR